MPSKPVSFSTNGYSVCVLFEQNKTVDVILQPKNKKAKQSKIILDDHFKKNKKIKKGLFDADNCKSSEEYLNNYHKIGIDPNNESLLYCYSVSFNFAKLKFTNVAKATLVNDLLVTRRETGQK